MNTYAKYCPNVFVAKCTEKHERGETIPVTTKYGKENECIVFNLVASKDGFFYYSIVRADGFNVQEFAKRRAERLNNASKRADKKGDEYYEAAQEGREFLSLGEPIKVGHHSEKRHRALIERNDNRMRKQFEMREKASEYSNRAAYWEDRASTINLSMPESIEYFEFKLQAAKEKHEALKSGKVERSHSFDVQYAKKEVNELTKKLETARKLWA